MKKLAVVALALLPLTNVASAESRSFEEYLIQENVTLLDVKSTAMIKTKPDMFRSVIEYTETDRSSKEAQADLNEEIAEATALIKQHGLEYKLQNFSTYKHHNSDKFTARQSIVLETADKIKLEEVTTKLQKDDGRVVSTASFITREGGQDFFADLFAKAKKDAVAKADMITKQMNADSYTITRMNYYTSESNVRPMMMRSMAAADAPESAKIEMDNSNKEVRLELTMSIAIKNK
jgi:uncharacterized protein YggE